MARIFTLLVITLFFITNIQAQHSVARRWNNVMLSAIRQDRARPPVQARNLYHFSMALYDAWACYEPLAKKVLLGNTIDSVTYTFNGIPPTSNIDSSRNIALSFAAYRFLKHRYNTSPNWSFAFFRFDTLMSNLGLDKNYTSENYATGNPADLGNYIAAQVIAFGFADGSNEINDFEYVNYAPINAPLVITNSNIQMNDPNRWQPLSIPGALDQAGNPIASIQSFVCPEWGRIIPFAMPSSSCVHYSKNGGDFPVYFDPGVPPMLDTINASDSSSLLFKWGHTMVALWSSHLDPDDSTMWDISPNAIGNIASYPTSNATAQGFYNYLNGGSIGTGHPINPATGMPYIPQMVKRGDYTRVLSQFWADGPQSETPPGHWYKLLNDVSDHPLFSKKMEGIGPVLSDLEWDVKSYLALGGGMHDAAIACWGIKGYYDAPRPISAIRLMAKYGQSSDSTLPSYHPAGLPLIPGHIELITATDSLVGDSNQNLNKIKIMAWKGFDSILSATNDVGHVGWILAQKWTPYQRKTFVTPPFAGYVSGHSTYSRAGATIMTQLTGNPYFPGGIAEYVIPMNSNFLVFEKGPTTDIHLQWATYRDASDEASLSRIWGSIHPPFDDFPARNMGEQIGNLAFAQAKTYFQNIGLPLQPGTFTAIERNCEAILNWETKSEINTNYFQIFASENGKEFSKLVGKKNAVGNSTSSSKYEFIDHNPYKTNYYKLVSVDIDGKEQTFPLAILSMQQCHQIKPTNWCTAFPNPTHGNLKLNITNESEANNATIQLLDISGRTILSNHVTLKSGTNESNIDLSKFKNGTYILKIESSNGEFFSQTISILK